MAKSYGYGLLDLVNGILPIAESPRAKSNAGNGVAWRRKRAVCKVSGSQIEGL